MQLLTEKLKKFQKLKRERLLFLGRWQWLEEREPFFAPSSSYLYIKERPQLSELMGAKF